MNTTFEKQTRVHARALQAFGESHLNAIVLSADLTSSTEADLFAETYPERFISMGMAEQNMMSVAGGLAREGNLVLCHDFAVFMYRRSLDQIEMSIAYPNLPVIIVGFLPGITTPGGVSHQAINDVAVMRSIPNVTILECGDASDVEGVLEVAAKVGGPVYIRMIRGSIPRLFTEPLAFNTARVLETGSDILIITSGICTEAAISAVAELRSNGVDAGHIHVTTLKPFDDPIVLAAIKNVRHGVLTVENHSIIGGLGSAVAGLIATNAIGIPLRSLGLNDEYGHGASKDYLMTYFGIDSDSICIAGFAVMGRSRVNPREASAKKPAVDNESELSRDEAL